MVQNKPLVSAIAISVMSAPFAATTAAAAVYGMKAGRCAGSLHRLLRGQRTPISPPNTNASRPDATDAGNRRRRTRHRRAAYNMLTNGDFYRDSGANYYTAHHPARTKARALNQLQTLGYHVTLQPLTDTA